MSKWVQNRFFEGMDQKLLKKTSSHSQPKNVQTKFGVVNCLKFRPFIESGRVFRDSESLSLWVSNDKNKIPVKMKAALKIGSIECDLENLKNLNHQFNI